MMFETNLACYNEFLSQKKIKAIQEKSWTKPMTEVLLQISTYFKMAA